MSLRDHEPAKFETQNGLFDRGDYNSIPIDHFIWCQNKKFTHFSVETRPGVSPYQVGLGVPGANIGRVRLYQRTDGDRYLTINKATGDLFQAVGNVATLIGNLPGATDFYSVSLFNRAYITPLQVVNGVTVPVSGQFIKVWDGTTFRNAAGLAPVGPTFAAATGAVGVITKGKHLISVAYETDTGFITPPGPVIFYVAPGKRKINLTNIPVGPAGTAKRHILMTKMIPVYDGNPSHYELFFLPDGTINDNVTTTLTINDIDSTLINSADYLNDLLTTIPASLGLCSYQGSLVTWGETGKESIARVSINGNPESFSSPDGFVIFAPADGGGLRRCFEYRGSLYGTKINRMYSTRANGDVASTWPVINVDSGYGCDLEGFGQIIDATGDTKDAAILVNNIGAHMFYGRFTDKPLTWKIDDLWRSFYRYSTQVVVDTVNKRIYISGNPVVINHNGVSPDDCLLVGDYNNGLSPDDIRWSLWNFRTQVDNNNSFNIASILCVPSTSGDYIASGTVGLKIAFTNKQSLYSLIETLTNDKLRLPDGSLNDCIESEVRYPYAFDTESLGVCHFTGYRAQILGAGILNATAYDTDDTVLHNFPAKTISLTPGSFILQLYSAVAEKSSVSIYQRDQTNLGYNDINVLEYYFKLLWASRAVS